MAEENQVMKESQQVQQEPKEQQRVTTKDPKKVDVGKRLSAINHKKREAKKRERRTSTIREDCQRNEPILWHRGCYSCEGDRWSWLLHLSNQERRSKWRATTK